MAKKTKKVVSNITPGFKPHATQRCEVEHCMGNPSKLIEAKTFCGKLCAECNLVHEYKPEEEINNQEKLEMKEEKVKKKTLTTSEKDLEKLIAEADKKEKKKVKPETKIQGSLF